MIPCDSKVCGCLRFYYLRILQRTTTKESNKRRRRSENRETIKEDTIKHNLIVCFSASTFLLKFIYLKFQSLYCQIKFGCCQVVMLTLLVCCCCHYFVPFLRGHACAACICAENIPIDGRLPNLVFTNGYQIPFRLLLLWNFEYLRWHKFLKIIIKQKQFFIIVG